VWKFRKENDPGTAGHFSPLISLIFTDFTERLGGSLTHLLSEDRIPCNLLKISEISGSHLPFLVDHSRRQPALGGGGEE
jgi:hypothetical protein